MLLLAVKIISSGPVYVTPGNLNGVYVSVTNILNHVSLRMKLVRGRWTKYVRYDALFGSARCKNVGRWSVT